MGKILVDVLSLKHEGLTGYTEEGQDIRLKSPQSRFFLIEHSLEINEMGNLKEAIDRKYDQKLNEILAGNEYVLLGKKEDTDKGQVQYYKAYKEKK
jgi:hypothetical protein